MKLSATHDMNNIKVTTSLRAHAKQSIASTSTCSATGSPYSLRSYATTQKTNAFTLIELSIVLVIIGLIVGGVLVGQDLIRAAQLKAILSEKQQFQTAVHTFRLKYAGLPGDMDNATDFWPAISGSCFTVIPTGEETCDGDGDRLIETHHYWGSAPTHESFRFWQQLANAGLIEGSYTGTNVPPSFSHSQIGVNIPASQIPNAGWTVMYKPWSRIILDSDVFHKTMGNSLLFGAEHSTADIESRNPVITPNEAFQIDSKIDDGTAGSGKVMHYRLGIGVNGVLCSDTNIFSPTDFTGEYNVMSDEKACNLHFLNVF